MAREWCYKFHNEPWREKKVPRPWTKATEVGSIQLVFIEKSSDCSRNILLSWHGGHIGGIWSRICPWPDFRGTACRWLSRYFLTFDFINKRGLKKFLGKKAGSLFSSLWIKDITEKLEKEQLTTVLARNGWRYISRTKFELECDKNGLKRYKTSSRMKDWVIVAQANITVVLVVWLCWEKSSCVVCVVDVHWL